MACPTYTCSKCGGTFDSTWSDADAIVEFQGAFSEAERAAKLPAVVCDDCYPKVMRKIEQLRRHAPGPRPSPLATGATRDFGR